MKEPRDHFIQELKDTLKISSFNKKNAKILLSNIRDILEFDNSREEYKTLAFYCDWIVHTSISRNKRLYKILNIINVSFSEINIKGSHSDATYPNYIDIIIDALNFKTLEKELFLFLIKKVDLYFTLKGKNLIYSICENLVQRKILYPKKENNIKKDTLSKVKEVHNTLNTSEKYLNPKLDPNTDYSTIHLINSITISKVINREVFIELELEEGKKAKIYSSIKFS